MTQMTLSAFEQTITANGSNDLDSSDPTGAGGGGGGTGSNVVSMSLSLTTAGRLGFYVDYSELATTGTHTFYVIRTHGTAGAVSCGYSTGGDTHTTVSGTLSWADGEANIKSFTATVSSKPTAGDHRMWALLDTPTGGAVLHNGAAYTIAYGVIDDGTISLDADAVFYDSAAGTGTGTQADPYGSYITAVANVGSKRYIYGKGTTVVDGTHTDNITGNTVQTLPVPATRSSEATRCYVRNWPGFTWAVNGDGGTSSVGFFSGDVVTHHTFRGIDIGILNNQLTNGVGIHYNATWNGAINVELCDFDNINGKAGSNHSGFAPFSTDGYRMWRCTANNIQNAGDNANINTAGFQTYQGTNGSVQRCTFTNAYHGVYHKQALTGGGVSTASRFNFMNGVLEGVAMREAGGTNDGHLYTIIQNNLFKNNTNRGIYNWMTLGGGAILCDKYAISNNVFDTCAASDRAAVHFRGAYNTQIYNNIMIDCREVWSDYQDGEAYDSPDVEYADYNVEFGTTSTKYVYRGTGYATAAALYAATGFGNNDTNADPVFTNRAANDYTLDTGSSGIDAGISGVDCGIYLAGIEVVGSA